MMKEQMTELMELILLMFEFALVSWAILKTINDSGKDDEDE